MWPLIWAHLFICIVEGDGHCKQIPLGCMGSTHSGWAKLGLPQPKAACASRVYTAHAPGGFVGALSQVDPVPHALPKSKPLRFSGATQGHRPKWAVQFVSFPVLSSSGYQVFGECTVPGEPCIFITSPVLVAWFPGCVTRAPFQVCHMSPLGS